MCRFGLGILPPLFVFLSVSTFVVTYLISLHHHHDTTWFPVIGSTIDRSPEKNIFAQLFNVSSVLALVTVFVRYLQLRHDADWNENDRPLLLKLNKVAFVLGVLATLGGNIVSNFHENGVQSIQITGASIVFTCGILYCWGQSLISYKMKMCGLITTTLFTVRLILAIVLSTCFVASLAATSYAREDWIHSHLNRNMTHWWNPEDKGYRARVVGDISEWVVALSMLLYILTFCGEFKSVRMKIVVSRHQHTNMPLLTGMESDESLQAPLLF